MSSATNSIQNSIGGPSRPEPDNASRKFRGPGAISPNNSVKGSGPSAPAVPAANDEPKTSAPVPTPYFRSKNDKLLSSASHHPIETVHKNTKKTPTTLSPATDPDPDPDDQQPDPSSLLDLIPLEQLSRTAFTTAGTSFSSVSQGVKPPNPPEYKRGYSPAEVLEKRRYHRDMIVDSIDTSIYDNPMGKEADPRLNDWSERMRKCGKEAYFMPHPQTGYQVITNFWGCRVRVCPICSWRASIRKACKYTPRIGAYIEAHPTCRLRFVTLTDRSVPMAALGAQCARLHKAFAWFYRKLDHAFTGYLRCTDIDTCARDPNFTKFVNGQWEGAPMFVRPHIHAIMIQRPKNGRTHVVDSQIQDVWAEAMSSKVALDTHAKDIDAPFGAIKYGSKGVAWGKAEGDYQYAAALALAIDGVRCTAAGGVLRG